MNCKITTVRDLASGGHFVCCWLQGTEDLISSDLETRHSGLGSGVIPKFTSQLCPERAVTLGQLCDTPEPQLVRLYEAHKGMMRMK